MGPNIHHGAQIYFQTWQHLANGNSSEFLDKPMRAPDLPALGVSSELSSDNRVFQMEGYQETAKYETTYSLHANDHKSRK